MKINENLVKYRKIKGFTQEEMAEKMQVSRQSVSKWENGEAVPELAKIIKLADIFDVSLDVLCGRAEKDTNAPESKCVSEKKKCNKLFLIIMLAVTIVVSGIFGYCIGHSEKEDANSELYELPDIIEVTGVTFHLEENMLTCEFVPSVYSEKLSYHVNVSDFFGKKTSYEPEFKNGIGEASMIVSAYDSYKVVLEITNGEESRSITLIEEIFIENNGFSYYE